jgi:hypothetical protein
MTFWQAVLPVQPSCCPAAFGMRLGALLPSQHRHYALFEAKTRTIHEKLPAISGERLVVKRRIIFCAINIQPK